MGEPAGHREASPPSVHSKILLLPEEQQMQVEMHIETEGEACGTDRPYDFRLVVFAVLRYEVDQDDEKQMHLAFRNALSILYGSAREYLLVLTSRAPWGGYQLPTMPPQTLLGRVQLAEAKVKDASEPEKKAGG